MSEVPPRVLPPRVAGNTLVPGRSHNVSRSDDSRGESQVDSGADLQESAIRTTSGGAQDFRVNAHTTPKVERPSSMPAWDSESALETPYESPLAIAPGAEVDARYESYIEEPLTEAAARGAVGVATKRRWFVQPFWLLGRSWDFASLLVLLAVVAAVPIVQLASLGYLLRASANLAQRRPWREALPGLRRAGKLGTFFLIATLLWLPVWLVTDLSYSAQLLQPGSDVARAWRIGAFVSTFAWVMHVGWAAMRGGRWWHLMWPAPIRFLRQIWRPSTWKRASDGLYDQVESLRFPSLWWLGARAAVGALLWITVPVSLMIIGLRAQDFAPAGLVGFIGAVGMIIVMLYLPFLQIQLAVENRFAGITRLRTIRRRFLYAPWAHALSLLTLCLMCIPLYLLRIEATPAELLWAPSLVFVLFMLPAKILLGAAMGYAEGRRERELPKRHWVFRWPARFIGLASVLVYVGALYVAQLVAGQGAFVMYFQHAFLVPAPLIAS